jgi:integrase/recombinase XerD
VKLSRLFAQYLKYLEIERGAALATRVAYQIDFDQFLRFLEDAKPADDRRSRDNLTFFTAEALRDFQYSLADHRFAAASIARKLAVLGGFGRWLEDWNHLDKNPARRLNRPKRPRAIPRHLALDAYRRLMALPLPRMEDVLRSLLAYAGLRRGEILALTVADVRLEDRRLPSGVTVAGYVRVLGKGGRERVIPFGRALKDRLVDYLLSRGALEPGRRLFEVAPGRALSPRRFNALVARWGRAAGVAGLHPHQFRHTFATLLLAHGANLREIQELLGHADLGTTQIYAAALPDHLAQTVLRLPDLERAEPSVLGASDGSGLEPPPVSSITKTDDVTAT